MLLIRTWHSLYPAQGLCFASARISPLDVDRSDKQWGFPPSFSLAVQPFAFVVSTSCQLSCISISILYVLHIVSCINYKNTIVNNYFLNTFGRRIQTFLAYKPGESDYAKLENLPYSGSSAKEFLIYHYAAIDGIVRCGYWQPQRGSNYRCIVLQYMLLSV